MALNPGKYKPSISAIDEVDDHSLKHTDLQKLQIEGSETAPLTTNQQKLNIDENLTAKDDADGNMKKETEKQLSGMNKSVHGLRGRLSFDALMRLSRKRRLLYVTTVSLCAVLLIIIIMMIAFWPEVPFYLKAELCLEKECVLASQQILLWANTSKSTCRNTYEWACGNFANEYSDHEFFVIKRGEWNFKSHNEYQELNALNRFISILPTSGTVYSLESMIRSLYRSCREIDTLDKSQSDLMLKKAIVAVDGWHAFRDTNRLQSWEYKKALIYLQANYGIFPYYRISIANRFNNPLDYIIKLDEGEIGLPSKYFYNFDQGNKIVRSYKLLLRDFAINIGIVSREAELFSDDVFHYEKRIVNHIQSVRRGIDQNLNQIKTLAEMKAIAPSLPISETIQAMFPDTKISDETELLVRNVEIFSELSTVVSTSDKKPINNFIIWSLARHLLPHLSKEYRNLVESFDHVIYGRIETYPRWLICTKIVRDWLPFAVDALQQNPTFIKSTSTEINTSQMHLNSGSFPNKTYGNEVFLRLMYYSLRNQLQSSVNQADWIDSEIKQFINEKLTTMRLQIGIPEECFQKKSYIKDYYNDLLLNNIYFVEHIGSMWSFRKAHMEKKLKTLNIVDTIISEMYTHEEPRTIAYSSILNMLIFSRNVVFSNYYDYKFPVSVNFARVGTDILEVLIESFSTFIEQYKTERGLNASDSSLESFTLAKVDVECILADETNKSDLNELSESALNNFYTTLSAVKIAAKALSAFTKAVDTSSPIIGASINQALTYENLRLTQRHRIPGLRSYNDNELFTLAYMQKHCSTSISDKDYTHIKPYVEQKLAERYLFNATWKLIQFLPLSSSCFVPDIRCFNII